MGNPSSSISMVTTAACRPGASRGGRVAEGPTAALYSGSSPVRCWTSVTSPTSTPAIRTGLFTRTFSAVLNTAWISYPWLQGSLFV
jgi:hypothetical protein